MRRIPPRARRSGKLISGMWPAVEDPPDTEKPQTLIEQPSIWRSQHVRSTTEGVGAARFAIPLDARMLEYRAEQWVRRRQGALSAHVGQALEAWLDPQGEDPVGRGERFVDALTQAVARAAPLVSISTRTHRKVHGDDVMPAHLVTSPIPLTAAHKAYDRARAMLLQAGVPEGALPDCFGANPKGQEIEVTTFLSRLVHPVVFDSLTAPILESWTQRRTPQERTQFWTFRRARTLTSFVPLSPSRQSALVRGWLTANVLEQVDVLERPWEEAPLSVWTPGGPRRFPPRLLGPDVESHSGVIAALFESLPLALLSFAADRPEEIDAYTRLTDLGEPEGHDLGRELRSWILDGRLPSPDQGKPAAPVPSAEVAGPQGGTAEERAASIAASLEAMLESYLEVAAGEPTPIWSREIGREWDLRDFFEREARALTDAVNAVRTPSTKPGRLGDWEGPVRVIMAPQRASADEVLERLIAWSEAGLLAPFCWWRLPADGAQLTGDEVLRVARGEEERLPVQFALLDVELDDVRLLALQSARRDERPDPALAGSIATAVEIVRKALPFDRERMPECAMVVACQEVQQPVPEGVFHSTWLPNVFIAPEDRIDPLDANVLQADPHLFPGHVAHALATLGDLWAHGASAPGGVFEAMLARQREMQGTPVQVMRCFTRGVDFGHLPDHVAAAVFEPADGWPNPDRAHFDRIAEPEPVLRHVLDGYTNAYREVLGLTPFKPLELDPPPEYGLLEALRILWREIVARLRRKPRELVEGRLRALHDRAAERIMKLDKRFGSGELRVRPWGQRDDDDKAFAELERTLEAPLFVPDGPVREAWADLTALSFGLIDGSPLPECAAERALSRGGKRALVADPAAIAPDPADAPPPEAGARACDPLQLDPRFNPPKPASGEDDEELDVEPATGGFDPAAWTARHGSTLLWRVGTIVARNLKQAQAEGRAATEGATSEEAAREEALRAAQRVEFHRGLRRTRRNRILTATLFAIIAAAAAWTQLDWLFRAPALAIVVVGWFLAVALAAQGKLRAEERSLRDELQSRLDRLNDHERRALRTADAERLTRRYREYLDWAEIIGALAHRPWIGDPLGRVSTPPQVEPASLPAAFRMAYGVSTPESRRRLASQTRTDVFQRAWLNGLYHAVEAWVGARAQEDRSALGRSVERLDAAADVFDDPESGRHMLLAAVRSGEGRRLGENPMTAKVLRAMGSQPVDGLAPGISRATRVGTRDAGGSEAVALGPAVAWFSAPDDLEATISGLREAVVRVEAETHLGPLVATGVTVDRKGLVATTRRLIEQADPIHVVTADGRRLPATVQDASPAATCCCSRRAKSNC